MQTYKGQGGWWHKDQRPVLELGRGDGKCPTGWRVESLDEWAEELEGTTGLLLGLCSGPGSPPLLPWEGMAMP